MARRNPPNLLSCRACDHEWTAKHLAGCRECKGDDVAVHCGAYRKTVTCPECRHRGPRAAWQVGGGAQCPKCGRSDPHDLLCRQLTPQGGRCYLHGKNSLVGEASPAFRDGSRSVLPERYRLAFQQSLRDPHQLRSARDIALLDARRAELVGRLSTGESGEAWDRMEDLVSGLIRALEEGDADELVAIAGRMRSTVTIARRDDAVWRELSEVVGERRKTVDVEVKRVKAEKDYLPMELVMALIYGMIHQGRDLVEATVRQVLAEAGVELEEPRVTKIVGRQYSGFARGLRELAEASQVHLPGEESS